MPTVLLCLVWTLLWSLGDGLTALGGSSSLAALLMDKVPIVMEMQFDKSDIPAIPAVPGLPSVPPIPSSVPLFGPTPANLTLKVNGTMFHLASQDSRLQGNVSYDSVTGQLSIQTANGWTFTANVSEAQINGSQWQVPILGITTPLLPSTLALDKLNGINASSWNWSTIGSFTNALANLSVTVWNTSTIPPTIHITHPSANASYDATTGKLTFVLKDGRNYTVNVSSMELNGTSFVVPLVNTKFDTAWLADWINDRPSIPKAIVPRVSYTVEVPNLLLQNGYTWDSWLAAGQPDIAPTSFPLRFTVKSTAAGTSWQQTFQTRGDVSIDGAHQQLTVRLPEGLTFSTNLTSSLTRKATWQVPILNPPKGLNLDTLAALVASGMAGNITVPEVNLPDWQDLVPTWAGTAGSPEPSPPSGLVPGRRWIHWAMSGTVEGFDSAKRKQFQRYIASFLEKPSWVVNVVSVLPGSIQIAIRLDGYDTVGDEEAAIAILRSSCTRAAPAFGIQCHTFQVTAVGETAADMESAGRVPIGIVAGVVGLILILYLCLGCAAVLLRRQKRLNDSSLTMHQRFLTNETVVEGIPIEMMELKLGDPEKLSAPMHTRVPTLGEVVPMSKTLLCPENDGSSSSSSTAWNPMPVPEEP